jgi:hypothetical protein
MRLRPTAPATFFVTVNPKRASARESPARNFRAALPRHLDGEEARRKARAGFRRAHKILTPAQSRQLPVCAVRLGGGVRRHLAYAFFRRSAAA